LDAAIEQKQFGMALRKLHTEAMKSLHNGLHSDVVLVSEEKEELQAHKNILGTHSRVNYIL
jgi:hypothetical protein